MVSFGPNTQSLNYTHMSYLEDTRGELCIQPSMNSVWDYIYNNPDLTKVRKLIIKANMVDNMNDDMYNTTLFLADDKALAYLTDEAIQEMDIGMARNIILACSVQGKIDESVLTSSFSVIIPSKLSYLYVAISNTNKNTLINGFPITKFNIPLKNGMIHLTSNLISGY